MAIGPPTYRGSAAGAPAGRRAWGIRAGGERVELVDQGGREKWRTVWSNDRGIVGCAYCAGQPMFTGGNGGHECRHDGVRPHDVGVGTQRDHGCVTRRTIVTPNVD